MYDALALTRGARLPTHAGPWLALLGVALFGTVIAIAAFFAALALLGPGDTAVVSTLEPVVSVVAAAVFLGETLTSVQLAGGVLVIGAVVAAVYPLRSTDRHRCRSRGGQSAAPAAGSGCGHRHADQWLCRSASTTGIRATRRVAGT